MIKALLFSSLVLNLGLLLGRLSGFARQAFIATVYGDTTQADIVVLMLKAPDVLVNILMGGAFGAALIPEFTKHPDQARTLMYQSALFFGILSCGVAACLYWQPSALVTILAPGFEEKKAAEAAVALSWVIWLIPLTVLAGIVTAYLHAQNKFAVPALGTLVINISIVVGLLLVYNGYGSWGLVAVFVLLGGLLRLLSQLLMVRPAWKPLTSIFPNRLNKKLLIRYVQAMLSGGLLFLFPVVAGALASYDGDGSLALMDYAIRLVAFPLALAVTFLAVVFFPRLSQSFSTDPVQHRMLIRHGVQITLGLSLIAAIALISQSDSYAEVVYDHGEMPNSGVELVATLTAICLITLPLQGLSIFLTSVYNARKDTRTPMLLNGAGLLFFWLTNYVGVFGQGLEALMWGMVSSFGLICVLQLTFLRIEYLSWWKVLLDREFLLGGICAVAISGYANHLIGQTNLSAWLSLVIACFVALSSLLAMALFNGEYRSYLLVRLRAK